MVGQRPTPARSAAAVAHAGVAEAPVRARDAAEPVNALVPAAAAASV